MKLPIMYTGNPGLSELVEGIQKERNEQETALALRNENNENATATYSTVIWLSDESEKNQQGLGARFMLCKGCAGELSEYTLQLGNFHKTRNQRFSRQGDSGGQKLDLSIKEWQMLISKSEEMTKILQDSFAMENQRYAVRCNSCCAISDLFRVLGSPKCKLIWKLTSCSFKTKHPQVLLVEEKCLVERPWVASLTKAFVLTDST